jgi:hypothetical protein
LHKFAFRWSHGGVSPAGNEIEHVDDRAPDVLLPRKHYQAVANGEYLVLDSVGETNGFICNYLDSQLAFRVNGDPRFELRKNDLEHSEKL